MIIYFVRHGETNANSEGKIQGQVIDEGLNENGVKQVRDILPDLPDFDLLFSSPLRRAKQSAEIISQHTGKNIIFRKDIMERDFGSFSGKLWSETPLKKIDITNLISYPLEEIGGESFVNFRERIRSFLNYLKKEYSNKTLLVVAHGGVIIAVHDMYPKKEILEGHNASIHEFEI